MDLAKKSCVPCEGGTKPMGKTEAAKYLRLVDKWGLNGSKITREIKFKNFKQALSFVDRVGAIAESEGHHPDIYLHSWNRVRLTLYTHAIGGLSVNDFILAAKINNIA